MRSKKCARLVMLIAGGQPHPAFGAEYLHIEPLAQHAGKHTQIWIIQEATHCDGPSQRQEEYARRMLGFFDDSLNISR